MRVLIVDDNASMRNLLTALLASQGYEVIGALEEGNGVIETVEAQKPNIVCLDYELPGRNGLDILKEINRRFPEIDVLFITGSQESDIEERAADAGAAGFLRKPFGQMQVIEELREVCDARHKALQANLREPSPETPVPAINGRPAGITRTAVIVDDNSSIRLLLKGIMIDLGLTVIGQAGNGEEAIRAAAKLQPAVLFLDVNMPVLSGLDALPKIRQASPGTAVVMVTGDTSKKLVQQAASLGARGYIVKPVRPAYVERFLEKLFNPS